MTLSNSSLSNDMKIGAALFLATCPLMTAIYAFIQFGFIQSIPLFAVLLCEYNPVIEFIINCKLMYLAYYDHTFFIYLMCLLIYTSFIELFICTKKEMMIVLENYKKELLYTLKHLINLLIKQ